MPITVNIPGVGDVDFPESMSDDEITNAIRFNILGEVEEKPLSTEYKAPAIGAGEALVSGVSKGAKTAELGRLAYKEMHGGATVEELARIGQIESEVAAAGETTGFAGWTEPAGEFVGQMGSSATEAAKPAIVGAVVGSAVPVIGTGAGAGAGFGAGMLSDIFQIESGIAHRELGTIKGEKGEEISPTTKQAIAGTIGLMNTALEITGLKLLSAPFRPFVKGLLKQGLQEAVKRGVLSTVAKSYTKAVLGETSTEVLQETSNILGAEIAKEFSVGNFEHLNTPKGRAEAIDRLLETAEKTFKGTALLGVPGAVVQHRTLSKAPVETSEDINKLIEDITSEQDETTAGEPTMPDSGTVAPTAEDSTLPTVLPPTAPEPLLAPEPAKEEVTKLDVQSKITKEELPQMKLPFEDAIGKKIDEGMSERDAIKTTFEEQVVREVPEITEAFKKTSAPAGVAEELGITYNGAWDLGEGEPLYQFTDPETKASFSLSEEPSLDNVKKALESKRAEFSTAEKKGRLDAAIHKRVAEQYGESAIERFEQLKNEAIERGETRAHATGLALKTLKLEVREPKIADVVQKLERRSDAGTRTEVDRIHLKAKEQGIDSLTDAEINFLNETTADRSIAQLRSGETGTRITERKARKEELKKEAPSDKATEAIRRRILKLSDENWVETFDEYKAEALAEGKTSSEANTIASKRVYAEFDPSVAREMLKEFGQSEKKAPKVTPIENAPVTSLLPEGSTIAAPVGVSTEGLAKVGETEAQDVTIEREKPSDAEVKAAMMEYVAAPSFDALPVATQNILNRAGKGPVRLSAAEVYKKSGQSVGSTKKGGTVTVDFLGFQAAYEKVMVAIKNLIERWRMDFAVSEEDMQNYVINEHLQTPRDIARTKFKLQPVVTAQDIRDVERNKMEHKFANMTKAFWELGTKAQKVVGDVLFQGDAQGREFTETELREKLKFTDAMVTAYVQVRSVLDEIKQDYITELKKSLEEVVSAPFPDMKEATSILSQIQSYEKLKGYMPHMRFGEKAIVVEVKKNDVWNTAHLESFETDFNGGSASMKRKKAFEALRGKATKTKWKEIKPGHIESANVRIRYVDLRGYASEYLDDLPNSAHFESILGEVQALQEKMKAEGKPVTDVVEKTREILTRKRMVSGFSRHWVQRENISGYSRDSSRVLAQYFNGFAGYKTKFDAATEMYAALAQIHPGYEKRLYDYTSRYIDYLLKHKGPEWHRFKAFMFYWYLGGNIKSAMVNGTQNLITAAPALGVYSGKSGYRAIIKAMTDVARQNVTKEEANFLERMKAEGITRDLLTSELMGAPNNIFQKRLLPGGLKALRFFFSSVEVFNRETTALAFYRAARAKGVKLGVDVENVVADAVRQTHFSYGKVDRPQLGRGRKGVLLTFRLFSIQYVQFMKNLIKDGEYAAAGKSAGMMLALSGMRGLFAFELINTGLGWATGDDLEERIRFYTNKAAESLLGKSYPRSVKAIERIVTRGIPAAFGVDFSGSLGAGDMIPQGDLLDLVGAPGGLIKAAEMARRDFKAGNYSRALETMSPEFLRNPQAAIRLVREGMVTHGGTPKLDVNGKVIGITPFEASLKGIGVQPIKLSETYKIEGVKRTKEEYRRTLKSTYLDAIMVKWNEKDFDGAREIWAESQAYDEKQPFYDRLMIMPEDVQRRAYERIGMGEYVRKQELEKLFGGEGD